MDRTPACGRRRARPAGAGRSAQVVADSQSRRFSSQLFPPPLAGEGRVGGSEESRLFAGVRLYQAEVLVGELGRDAPAGRPRQKTELHQEWFVDVLDGLGILRYRDRDGVQSDRAAFVLLDDGAKDAAVDGIETELIDLEHGVPVA